MNRRKVLLLSGSAILCAPLTISAIASSAEVHDYVLPYDLPFDRIVAVNDAFNCFDAHQFTLHERANAFGLDSNCYFTTSELRDVVLTHVVDYGSRDLLDRTQSIATVACTLESRFPGNCDAQRAFMNAPSDLFSFSGISLRAKMTSRSYYDLTRAALILAAT